MGGGQGPPYALYAYAYIHFLVQSTYVNSLTIGTIHERGIHGLHCSSLNMDNFSFFIDE